MRILTCLMYMGFLCGAGVTVAIRLQTVHSRRAGSAHPASQSILLDSVLQGSKGDSQNLGGLLPVSPDAV